ncbi:hypothetical protein [Bythopirellula polymerisocia]|uniref:Uncharacterized protein n=1 Tax=Bythopirellula polymerisocia TaxID=2528003 RepID=A0A5C6C9P3_9BACT|nr:hypothetical protein [Bythopirellula polymerisocia]TWU20898.1 hypothetical protein Pla144_47980 [Bythopirellula polymerisocia]
MSTTIESPNAKASSKEEKSKSFSSRARRANFWSDSAPKNIVPEDNWETWVSHLSRRRNPRTVDALFSAKVSSLAWGLEDFHLEPLSTELLQLLARSIEKGKLNKSAVGDVLLRWLQGTNAQPQSVDFAIECLAVAHLLPSVVSSVEEDFWWSLIDALGEIVACMEDWQIDAEMPAESCLVHQLLAGELPLTLAYLFPEMRPLAKLRKSAHDALSEGLIELTNGEGLPRASHLSEFRAFLASWTRCSAMGSAMKKRPWTKKAEEQFHYAIARSLMLSCSTGAPLLASENSSSWSPDFLEAVLKVGGNSADRTAALDMFIKKIAKHLSGKSGKEVPETSYQCEWAGLAVLRTEYSRSAPVVAIDYATPDLKLDVWVGTQRLLAGTWSTETMSGGKKLEPVGVWEQTCWFSDEDVDYLELAIDLSHGARLERQILLARDDNFLLLADNVLDTPGDAIQHRFSLPLGAEIQFKPEAETRDGTLEAIKSIGRVLPLALPEWRTDPRIGELKQVGDQLQLSQDRPGRRLACPLFIDLDPSRLGKPCTWRQLAVAQALELQPHDVAVGYRAQFGKSQWLIYRSLSAPANRTVLGQNTSVEYLIGRFLAPGGEVEELLQVEG